MLRQYSKTKLKNIEIIIINDASSDRSQEILEKYAKKDKRIQIYKNEKNLGTFQTRLKGVLFAKGKYVYMIDSDDWIEIDALESMYATAIEYSADIVHIGTYKVYYNKEQKLIKEKFLEITPFKNIIKNETSLIKELFKKQFNHSLWNKLIKQKI